MIRAALKLLTYLSILTSTRTSSSYLEPQSLVSFRRSAATNGGAPAQQQVSDFNSDNTEWRSVSGSETPFFIPRLVNANNMLLTQLNSNNRRASKKGRKSKKSESSKLLYENHSKRKNSFSSTDDQDDLPVQVNENSNNKTVTRNHTANNEYPTAQIDPKHERELQELFGVEGARKYQEYQLQQQMFASKDGKADGDVKEAQKKRDNGMGTAEEMQDVSGAMINQMMSRTTRRQREYDVPLIQCPPATDGMERFACPTPDRQGRYRCIDDHVLCDGFIDCPEGADEDRQACMFYKTTKAHLDVLADALLRWARGR